jgi:DNA-binding transcriptional regulator YiaG
MLGVNEATVFNWEGNRTTPSGRYWARLMRFL